MLKIIWIAHSLNNAQWGSINHILKSKSTDVQTQRIQRITRDIIYDSYNAWAVKQAYLYKLHHENICRNIRIDDLSIYSRIGLYKATQKYNPYKCGLFTKYASIYVRGEMYRGVKVLIPKMIEFEYADITNINNNILYEDMTYSISHKLREWRETHNITHFENHCIIKKYMVAGKRPRSNAEVAKRMGCSEELVRVAVNKIRL